MLVLLLCCTLVLSQVTSTSVSFKDPTMDINATASQPVMNRINGPPVRGTGLDRVPYIAKIKSGRWKCSGVLIRPQWVLTAAHCVKKAKQTVTLMNSTHEETLDKWKSVIRPEYDPKKKSPRGHDIGLIKVDQPSWFNPIALMANSKSRTQSTAKAYGFGQVFRLDKWVNSPLLRVTWFKLSSRDAKACGKRKPKTLICPEVEVRNGGVCKGDSGGPLIVEEDVPRVYGIISGGRNCTKPKKQRPNIELVPYHYNWIVSTINLHDMQDAEIEADKRNRANKPALPMPRPMPYWRLPTYV